MSERIKIIIHNGLILLILVITVLVKIDVLYSQENWVWSEPIQIQYHGDTPDIDVDRKNSHAHIISMKTYGEGILYSEVDSLGNVLIKGSQVPTDFGDKGGIYYGATVAVDQQGYPHIIYRRHLANYWYYHLYYIYKTSNGWSKDKLIATNVRRGYIVRMDIDGNNRVHLIYSSVNDSLWGKVTYYQIQDGEVVNQLSQTLTDPQSQEDIIFIVENRFDIESSYDGSVHVVLGCPFRRNGSITYFYSNDNGENFTEWGQIQSDDCTRRLGDPDICLDKVGNIHICYGSNNDKALNYEPSIRYVRMSKDAAQENYIIQEHNIINHPGSIEQSSDDSHWGVGSIAVSDEGKYVIGTYLSKPEGILWARISEDGGTTWGTPKKLSETCGGDLGRNLHLIRANRNHFYLVYPENNPQEVRMRIIHLGDYYPFASAGGPYSAKEGDVVELNMSASVDSGWYAGISEYAWDWNQDGVYDFKTTLPKVNHLFTDNLTGNAVLRVTDNSGKIDYDTTYCNIINVPPTVDAGDDIVCEEGDTLYFSAVVEDPGDDEITYLWDFNNGDYSYIPEPTYIYTDDSTYQVSVKVSDGDGGIDRDEIIIHVNNSDPIVEAGGPYQGVIKSNIFLTAQVHDKGASDEIIYKRWDLNNDQVFETEGYEAVANFKEAGTYTVWFKAGDDDGGVGLDSAVVLVSCEA
ncbi:MAG: PKD domain-containing protein, partial [bacterium]